MYCRQSKLAIGTCFFFRKSSAHVINILGDRYFKDVSHQLHVNVFSYECLGCSFLNHVQRIYTYPTSSRLIRFIQSCYFLTFCAQCFCMHCVTWLSDGLPEVHWLWHEQWPAAGWTSDTVSCSCKASWEHHNLPIGVYSSNWRPAKPSLRHPNELLNPSKRSSDV